ncbi:DUF2812 domain-containing protein [Ruminiclostridium herbifermentans]|uniref:DUF2812 domain-containing protein n=1 Tax=Ruminiclostridium herbifermentans TaxID=2488810 RepID=A0A4U7JH01_9FIRM|nr:DUF2812 domain-containing protein [Ruminiclostridium herbifermentans]QNU65944.1 DUF2812 domain-containing protein [Ruminiclostridium herbifermentans]
MIRIFKWWWAWNYEKIESWLESMENSGLRLVKTKFKGVVFYFENCTPTKARYCIDYQDKLTPEYISIINDAGWKINQIGMGWYVLRKQYEDERPELYTDFDALIARNKKLLRIMIGGLLLEFIFLGKLIYSAIKFPSNDIIAQVGFLTAFVLAFFTFSITNLSLQIHKFKNKNI